MTEPDIVAELDRWLIDSVRPPFVTVRGMAQRARDEIVALREDNKTLSVTQHARESVEIERRLAVARNARAEALEEAAQLCITHDPSRETRNAAAAIRALKDKP